MISDKETIYVILKDHFDLSARMGITINGIIGYNLLKNNIVKINYKSRKIHFYNPKTFRYPRCRKCEVFPMQFYRNKPYIDIRVQMDTIGSKMTDVKMLIDSGGSDAIWLFENTKEEIKIPNRRFRDILGEGLSGTIYGYRSRIPKIAIGKFSLTAPTVSFLDTASSFNARKFKQRNGSIGGNILKRFKVWLDYPNKRITLKKNGSFKGGFDYNMSGIDLIYNGKILVKELDSRKISSSYSSNSSENNTISFITSYWYKFKPSYRVNKVLPNSSAARAGVLKDDILLKINGEEAHKFNLKDIIHKFQEKDKKKIKLLLEREGEKITIEFRLEKEYRSSWCAENKVLD